MAAAAVAAALGFASAASAKTGPTPAPTPAPAPLPAPQTGTISPNTIKLTAGAPVPLTIGTLTPAAPTVTNLLASQEPDLDAYNDTFDRVLELLRQMHANRDRIINGLG
jgi:hypothetical protein